MTATDATIDDWAVHRPNVVRSVAARVPGVDADEATSRALEKMIRIVNNDGDIKDPAAYWRRAAINEAFSITREAGRAIAVEDEILADITPPVAGAELDAERSADAAMLRDALSDLSADERTLLFDRHVHDKAVNDIAGGLGVRPHAVTMRLRRAEERLAGAFAAAHANKVNDPECRTTRAAMHDYLKGRLLPRRSKRLEVHMDACADCTHAFVDVREVSWMLRELGQHLVGFFFGGAAVSSAATAAGAAAAKKDSPGKQAAVAASVIAALALAGGAWAYVASEPDTQAEATPEVEAAAPDEGDGTGSDSSDADSDSGSDGGSDADSEADTPDTEEPAPEMPPTLPPQDPQPRDDALPPLDLPSDEEPAPAPAPAEPAPAPEAEAEPAPERPGAGSGAQPEPEAPGGDSGSGDGDGAGQGNGDGGGQGNGDGQGDGGGQDSGGQDGGTGGGLGNALGGVLGEIPVLGDLTDALGLGAVLTFLDTLQATAEEGAEEGPGALDG
ncbi:hypothetical protein GCM10028784_34730 [Myceligenerans cantabricum]